MPLIHLFYSEATSHKNSCTLKDPNKIPTFIIYLNHLIKPSHFFQKFVSICQILKL